MLEECLAQHANYQGKDDSILPIFIYAACVGLSTDLGQRAKTTIYKESCSVISYGEKVYSSLVAQKVDRRELVKAGVSLLMGYLDASTFPTQSEVDGAVDFSEAERVAPTH